MAITKSPTIQSLRSNVIIERRTAEVIPVGGIVQLNASDEFVNATADVAGVNMVANEDGFQAIEVTDSYAVGDLAKAYVYVGGDKAYGNLATSQTVAIGDALTNDGAGGFKAVTAGEETVCIAMEAVTTTSEVEKILVMFK